MGCTQTAQIIPHIPPPKGPPIDPLTAEGNIIQNITVDPHINFYQQKIREVILPLRKKKNNLEQPKGQENNEMAKNQKRPSNIGNNSKNHNVKNKLVIQSFATTDNKQHQKYVETVNASLQNNEASVTNIMGYMIEEMADYREGKKAKNKFDNDSYAALKCFIYLYTGHYTYKKINSQLRRNQYDKISMVIAVVQKQLEEYNKQKFARKLKANQKHGQFLNLYRGIPKPDKTMVKGKKQYWKGFTSTSLETTVASRFGKYLFVINLQKNSPHPYMVVPEDLSQFKEEEILIFPYFYFECMGVEDFTSGARYQCKQIGFNQQ